MSNLFVLPNLTSQNRLQSLHLMGGEPSALAPSQGETVNDIIANAANANNAVLAYSHGLSSTKLPFVPQSPAWYNKFTESYSQIGANALVWQNSLSPRLIAIPKTIVQYGTLFDLRVGMLMQYADLLIANPNDMGVRKSLSDVLVTLTADIDRHQRQVNTFGTDLSGYAGTLQGDAAIMGQAVKDAMKEIGQDEAKVKALTQKIEDLKAELATWNKVVAGAGIGAAVSIFIGLIGAVLTVAFGPVGLLVVGLGVIGTAAGFATLIAGLVKVRQLGNDIAQQSGDLGAVQQRILALRSVQTNVDTLIKLSGTAQTEIGKLVTAWDLLKGGMRSVADDLANSRKRFDALQFVDMRTDFAKAEEDWKSLTEIARKFTNINITLEDKVNPASDRRAA